MTHGGKAAITTAGFDGGNAIQNENLLPGSSAWLIGPSTGTLPADDIGLQVKGYASATSVNAGDSLDFHVSVADPQEMTIAVYRLGHYGGAGARHLLTSPALPAATQPAPSVASDSGMISCEWPATWTLEVPRVWVSGVYFAVLSTSDGWRGNIPFVVRQDARNADFCVVLPFTTYQAYNMWPADGVRGKSLYHGFRPGARGARDSSMRALRVSFDRPFEGDGVPSQMKYDLSFLRWAEHQGYSLTYATSVDLHNGSLDVSKYRGLIFSGHDEYWSAPMRDRAERAVALGRSLAFMTANNAYWQIRFEDGPDGRPDRTFTCHRTSPDPHSAHRLATTTWRRWRPGAGRPEQELLGVQYRAMVGDPADLVVSASEHWVWSGTGVNDGDRIDRMVGVEADAVVARMGRPVGMRQTLLAVSPYTTRSGGDGIHHASICENRKGQLIFAAGTFHWPLGLHAEGWADARIQRATANLLDRMLISRTGPRPGWRWRSRLSSYANRRHRLWRGRIARLLRRG